MGLNRYDVGTNYLLLAFEVRITVREVLTRNAEIVKVSINYIFSGLSVEVEVWLLFS